MTQAELEMALNGMPTENAVGFGAVLGLLLAYVLIVSLVVWVFQIIVWWRIFSKAGQPGWKSIIPVYSNYVLYKITWKPKFFWVTIILGVAGSVVSNVVQSMNAAGTVTAVSAILSLILLIISVAVIVIGVIQTHKFSKAFGHGVGFTLGLIFLSPIFQLILAFGSSEYKGADL